MRRQIVMGQAYLPLAHNKDTFVLVESPRGCLKTCSNLNIIMSRAYQWPGKRWYIWRSTRSLLSTTVLPSFEEYVLPAWRDVRGMRCINPAARPMQRGEYLFENGSVITPVGLDDVQRGTSSEGAGGYLAEAVELDRAEQATALAGMMRQPGVPFRQIIVDCNPGPPGHWLNQIAEPVSDEFRRVRSREDYDRLQQHNRRPAANPAHRWKRIIARIQDNPFYFDLDRWRLIPEGEAYLKTLDYLPAGHLRRRWIDGEWIAAEGAVYPEFNESQHVIAGFEVPREWPCFLAEDPGYDHPTAIVLATVAPNGRVYIVAEIVRRQTTIEQDARDITDRLSRNFNIVSKLGDPHYMFSSNKHNSGETIAQQMRRYGHLFRPAPAARNQEEIAQQVEMVRSLLVRLGSDGRPMLQVFRGCTNAIRGFQSWGYERTSKGGIKGGADRFADVGDDEMDCVRMIISSHPTHTFDGIKVYGMDVE